MARARELRGGTVLMTCVNRMSRLRRAQRNDVRFVDYAQAGKGGADGTLARFSHFHPAFPRFSLSDGPGRGSTSEWRKKINRRGFTPRTITDRATVSRLIRAFCGLPRPSAGRSPE